MHGAVDDALEVARARRARLDAVVDVDPRLGWAVVGVHGEPVAAVAHRDTLGAVEGGKVVVGQLPQHAVHVRAVERLDGGHSALVDQPVMVGQPAGRGLTAPGQRCAICLTHRLDPYAK